MATEPRRVVVVGAGVTGLLTAIGCARAGHRVTVVDRGPIPNPACSSFDEHRAIRALDPGDVAATRRVATLHRRWSALEDLLGARLLRRVGSVTAWPAEAIEAVTGVAAEAGVRVAVVGPDTLAPIVFPAGHLGVLEPDGGVLLAERILRLAGGWLAERGGVTLWPHRAVVGVDAGSARVRLADGAALDADLVLVAAGPWSRALVDVPTTLYRQTMMYLRPPAALESWWRGAPTAGGVGLDGRSWLLPPGEDTLLKISTAGVCRAVDHVADGPAPEADRARLVAASVLADQERYTVVRLKQCHYLDDAAGGGARLVRLGPAVWARAASGGDGFRTAPLVADRIVRAAADGRPLSMAEGRQSS
jgi:glycine/D-amino acid oxidase-like deaminating enzyme